MRTQKPTLASRSVAGLSLCTVTVVILSTAGCKTKSAADSGFLENSGQMTAQRERFPFQRVWVKPGVAKENYDYVLIAPVNTAYMLETTGWKAANPGNLALDNAARELAAYTQDTFREAFRDTQNNRFRLADRPGPRTLTLELAITELVPSKAVLNAVAIASPNIAVGVAAGAAAGKPSVAIEGRVRDATTGEVIFMFADREEPQFRVVNVQGLTWWSHGRESIRNWSKQCVKLANTPKDEKVGERFPITLKPW